MLGAKTEVFFADIDEVRYRFDRDHGEDDDPPRIFLTTFEGVRVEVPPLSGAERLVGELDREVTRPLIEPACEALSRGDRLIFGPLVLELDGIDGIALLEDDQRLPWSLLPRVVVGREGFTFHMPDTYGRRSLVPLGELPHPRVLVDVLRMRTRVVLEGASMLGLSAAT